MWVGIFGYIAANIDKFQRQRPDDKLQTMLGCFMILVTLLNVIGVVLGILAVQRPSSNKWMGVVGLVVNLLLVGLFCLLIVIGLAVQNQR
jgi:hypothetical protein